MERSCVSQPSFDQVLWIGGPPDSGKTSIADILADRHDLSRYHFDRHEMDHFGRADSDRHPALWAAHPDRMTAEQRWLGAPPAKMAAATLASWGERFWMALEDLAAMSKDRAIIAEGPGLFPELVAPFLSNPRKAVWLIPSEAFKRASAARRGKPGNRHETSNPERATRNLIERDLIMGRHIREQCATLCLRHIEITGEHSIAATARHVEEQFSPWLSAG